jgi:DNA-binding transcriptional ArsR family regulator
MATIDLFPVLRSKTRREILKVLMKKEMHISGIAREFGISVPQASKHCKLLEEKGLVEKKTFGRTHVLRAKNDRLYGLMDYFSDETEVEVPKGSNIIDALTQVAGIMVEKADERGFVTSIDGEEGYYIYEVNGKLPNVPMDKFTLEKDVTVELKKILHVKKKRLDIKVKRGVDKVD